MGKHRRLRSGQHRLEAVAREAKETSPPILLEITPEMAKQMLDEKLKRGIEQAERGETHDLGDFSHYLTEGEGENDG